MAFAFLHFLAGNFNKRGSLSLSLPVISVIQCDPLLPPVNCVYQLIHRAWEHYKIVTNVTEIFVPQ